MTSLPHPCAFCKGGNGWSLAREAAQECSPQPALSLSKGRKPWVAIRKTPEVPQGRPAIARRFSAGDLPPEVMPVPEG